MTERLLITKIRRRGDGKGADLFAKGHRYPDTTLFDLSDLALVGLDYEALQAGVETPCRFWAIVQPGKEKPGSDTGARYLDVVTLEAIDRPATATSTDNSAILAELRAVRALLQVLAEAQGLEVPELPDLDDNGDGGNGDGQAPDNGGADGAQAPDLGAVFPRYLDGQALGDNPAEVQAFEQYQAAHGGQAPANVAALRGWFAGQRDNALPAEPSTRGRSKLYK